MGNNEFRNDSPVTSKNNMEYIPDIQQDISPHRAKNTPPFTQRIKKGSGILLLASIMALAIGMMCHTGTSVNTSDDAQSAIETHVSTTLPIGARLLEKDDHYVGGDMTITHTSPEKKTKMYIWDYAAEDGDYVQVYIDGKPLGSPFMIKNKPEVFNVPATGEVQVVGTRDGGGGITYAVRYELNHETYFNGMEQGGNNVYTLVRE
ncbi:hypothetical protein SAMN05216366_11744 [Selenomonas ruminantium]|uniref:Uncharacterized protein n=2 Tax=Selenomonas ruminantium TaxID=971 RepID=A0A1H0SFC9_SELRU|nr:hypothetical protein SAMN05216366_11744 [Selenomonas ruminantium]